ncbi:hypothetical protein SCA6_018472 [Theobroma cacao]
MHHNMLLINILAKCPTKDLCLWMNVAQMLYIVFVFVLSFFILGSLFLEFPSLGWNLDESSDEGNFPSWQDRICASNARALWVDLKPGNGMLEALMDAWGSYGQWMLNVVMGG